jgi:hypothetical protein
MTTSRFTPPLDYLQAASRASLQSFELTRLNHAANLRQEIAALIDQWIQETSEAMLARWMLDHHKALQSGPMFSLRVGPHFGRSRRHPVPGMPIAHVRHGSRAAALFPFAPPHEGIDRSKTSKTAAIRSRLNGASPLRAPHRRASHASIAKPSRSRATPSPQKSK